MTFEHGETKLTGEGRRVLLARLDDDVCDLMVLSYLRTITTYVM
ncbi:hypothetical protein [Streptomyces sp. AcH 505]